MVSRLYILTQLINDVSLCLSEENNFQVLQINPWDRIRLFSSLFLSLSSHQSPTYLPTYLAVYCYQIFSFFFFFFKFYFIFKLYLVLPNIKMNLPQVYMCSPPWTFLPPPSPYHPSGSSQCTSPKHPVSCIEPGLAIHFIYDIIHISMPFSQIISSLLLFTWVSVFF